MIKLKIYKQFDSTSFLQYLCATLQCYIHTDFPLWNVINVIFTEMLYLQLVVQLKI